MSKPPLYAGHRLPLNALSPSDFEDFVYLALCELGPLYGLRVTGKSGGSGDGGFDATAVRLIDQKLACIQCKHFETMILSTPQVAEELAKVALRSTLDRMQVVEHFVITSGKMTQILAFTREGFPSRMATSERIPTMFRMGKRLPSSS